jgi:N-acetylneuraminic acid mutarotase
MKRMRLRKLGLVAKNKDEKGASVAEHIRNGSTRGYKSQYISTTGSLECACKFAGMFQQIARVVLPPDLMSDGKMVIDFTNSTNRNQELSLDDLIFAKRSEEILILSKVDPKFVSKLVPTFSVQATSTCSQDLFDSLRSRKSEVVGGPNDGLLRLVATNSKPLIAKRPKPNIRNDELCDWDEMRAQTVQEYVCFQIYKICGIRVPECDFLEVDVRWNDQTSGKERKSVKCTALLLENFELLDESSTKEERDSLKQRVMGSREFADGFIVDCFVGNWQVLDAKLKNIDKDGVFRANLSRVAGFQTSEDKSKGYNVLPFGKEVLEIEELRKQAPFSVLSNSDIGEQIQMLISKDFKLLLARLNPEVRNLFEQRLEFLRSWLNWTQITPREMLVPCGRDGHVAFCSKENQTKLFVFGGNSKEGALDDVWCFDLNKSEWRRVVGNGAPSPRFSCSAACIGKYAFIIGGTDEKTLFDTVAVFNMESEEWDAWNQVGWPKNGVCRHACAVVGNQIFLFGGQSKEKKKPKRIGRFLIGRVTVSKKLVEWELQDRNGPAAVHRHAMCANKTSVFLIGGMSDDKIHAFSKLHMFDISSKKWDVKWTNGASVIGNKIRGGHSAFLWDKELVVFAGGVLSNRHAGSEAEQEAFGSNVVSTLSCKIFALNLENFLWRELTDELAGSPPCAMSGHTCSLLNTPKRVLIFGGRGDQDEFFSDIFSLRLGASEETRLERIKEKLAAVKEEVSELRHEGDSQVLLERIQGMENELAIIYKKHASNVEN